MSRVGKSTLASYRENLQKKVYPNGLTLLFQPVEHVASVSCGLFLKRGSVHEESNEAGYFHFVEHMLFKGTTNRSSKEIVEAVERVGGMINALTGREYTNYYISLIRDELPLAMDILSDMIFNPLFNEDDINLEMKVILEEIKSYEDNPEDYLYDAYYLSVFDNAPIGRNIAGTKESVQSVNSDNLRKFYNKHYTPENLILSISGNASIEEVELLVEEFFPTKSDQANTIDLSKNQIHQPSNSRLILEIHSVDKPTNLSKTETNSATKIESPLPTENKQALLSENIAKPKKFIKVFHKRKIEQVNFYLGAEGFARTDPQSPALIMACNILGGGMASRLFQEVREKHGYCYGIQCFPSGYLNTGITSIFCATSPENVIKATELILNEIDSLLKNGFSENEMENSRTNIIGSLAMGYEMTESRMNNIAIQEIYFGRFYSLMDRIELFSRITIDTLNETFRKAFGLRTYHLSAIGDLKAKEVKSLPHSIK